MTIDYRTLCAELLDELSGYASANPHHDSDALVARARAALAEPEPEVVGPSDEELDALWFEIDGRQGLGWKSFARAVLARWGNHPKPVPEPEVVGPLQLPEQAPDEHPPSSLDRREIAAWYHGHGCGWQAARAALAHWGHQPAPVPVSERLPGAEDCDENGDCWFDTGVDVGWMLCDKVFGLRHGSRWWLPFNALPLPSGEVEP